MYIRNYLSLTPFFPIHDIRESVNQDLVLGREDFKDKVEMMSQRKVRKGTPGRPCVNEEEGIYYVY